MKELEHILVSDIKHRAPDHLAGGGEIPLDTTIRDYLALPQDQIREHWKTDALATQFPRIVERLISPSGQQLVDPSSRLSLYQASLDAFRTFPLSSGQSLGSFHQVHQEGEYIPGDMKLYNWETGEITPRLRRELGYPRTVDQLHRMNWAAIFLLGLSLPDKDDAMERLITMYSGLENRQKRPIFDNTERLMHKSSRSRRWVVANDLATCVDIPSWDSAVASTLLNFPEYAITPDHLPVNVPLYLTDLDSSKIYSADAYDAFLDYAQAYANVAKEKKQLNRRRGRDLVAFTVNVRSLDRGEYAQRDYVQEGLSYINNIVNDINFMSRAPGRGAIHVRDILEGTPAAARRIYWHGMDRPKQ